MRIDRVRIDRYGPLSAIEREFDPGITVVHGPNESGKTLLLEGILRLLSPDIVEVMPSIERVDRAPVGELCMSHDGETTTVDPDRPLAERLDISPHDLRNVYVVRDSDLQLDNPHAFYANVTERIGDLHTTGIEAIKEEIHTRGRLTPTTRRLSDAADNDHAETVRDRADTLRKEIRSYLSAVDEADVEALEREAIALRTDRRRCQESLERQRQAREAERVDRLRDRLTTVESARTSPIDADRETLEELQDLVDRRRRLTDRLEEIERTIEDTREDLSAAREGLRDRRGELTAITDTDEAVETLQASLEEVRSDDPHSARPTPRRHPIGGLLGVVLGTIATIAGPPVLGVILLGAGTIALAVWTYRMYRHRRGIRRATTVIQKARDAGFAVETIEDVAPALRAHEADRTRLENEREELQTEVNVLERTVADLREERREKRSTLEETRAEYADRLDALDVHDVDEYGDRVARAEERRTEQVAAERSLRDALEEPTTEDPIDAWRAAIEARAAELPDDADTYDPDELERLERHEGELARRLDDIDGELAEHRERVATFAGRLRDLGNRPLLSDSLDLQAQTAEGLRDATVRLDDLVERLERTADVARELLDVFDTIEAEERHKISDLFGPASPASRVFSAVTDGRYEAVTYDADGGALRVQASNGDGRDPEQLSHATRDHLYLATRVGLARRLLGTAPGFFLLDDAFLPADPERLAAGFDVLSSLAEDGWQIIYFTAKPEVGTDLVDRRGLAELQLTDRL